MKKNLFLFLILLLLSGLTWFFYQKDRSKSMRGELTDFAVEDTASISKIIHRRTELLQDMNERIRMPLLLKSKEIDL